MIYNYIKSRGEFMYTMYLIFTGVLVLSFITGNILLLVEHKPSKCENIIYDKEII